MDENLKTKMELAVVLVLVISLSGYYIFQPDYYHYQAAPISGQVLDKITGEPVEGVHVAVYWQLYASGLAGLGGRVPTDVIGVSETITDESGRYYIPGWERYVNDENYLGEESPMIGFYKTGYKFVELYNSKMGLLINKDYVSMGYEYSKEITENGDVYTSTWDGKAIILEKENIIDNIPEVIEELYAKFSKKQKNSRNTGLLMKLESRYNFEDEGKETALYSMDITLKNMENVNRFIEQVLRGKGCESRLIKNFILTYSADADRIKEKFPGQSSQRRFHKFEDMGDSYCGMLTEVYMGEAKAR